MGKILVRHMTCLERFNSKDEGGRGEPRPKVAASCQCRPRAELTTPVHCNAPKWLTEVRVTGSPRLSQPIPRDSPREPKIESEPVSEGAGSSRSSYHDFQFSAPSAITT